MLELPQSIIYRCNNSQWKPNKHQFIFNSNNFMARYSISHLKINHIVANTQFTSSNTLSSVMFLPQIPEIKPTLCNNGISPQMEHVNWKVSPIWLQYGFTLQLAINRIFFGLLVFAMSSIELNLSDRLRSIYKPQNFNCWPNNRMCFPVHHPPKKTFELSVSSYA